MSPTADALLAAVRADPDADLPRLVYADHLDETGDGDRAKFIRVQCELAKLDEADPRRPPLEDREHDLLDRHEHEWLGAVPDAVDEWEWRRGFVAESVFRELDAAIIAWVSGHPITAVACRYLSEFSMGPRDTVRWPATVRRLELYGMDAFDSSLITDPLAEGGLSGLRELVLHDSEAVRPGQLWATLSDTGAGRRLTRLSLDEHARGAETDVRRAVCRGELTDYAWSADWPYWTNNRWVLGDHGDRLRSLVVARGDTGTDTDAFHHCLPADASLVRLDVPGCRTD